MLSQRCLLATMGTSLGLRRAKDCSLQVAGLLGIVPQAEGGVHDCFQHTLIVRRCGAYNIRTALA